MLEYAKQKSEVPRKKKKSLSIFGKHKDSYAVNPPEPSPKPMRKYSVPAGEPKQVLIIFYFVQLFISVVYSLDK